MPKPKLIRPVYAELPADLAKRLDKAAANERRNKREILIAALELYLAPAAAQPATPAPEAA